MSQLTQTEVIARAEILDTLVAYCQAQDQEEWDLYERVFTPQAVIEFFGADLPPMPAGDFKRFLIDFNGSRISGQHLIGNVLFRIAGSEAHTVSEVNYLTLHPAGEGRVRRVRGNALYADRLTLAEDGWRIAHRSIAQKNIETDETEYEPRLLESIRSAAQTRWFDALAGTGR